jgi:hypothetical protein
MEPCPESSDHRPSIMDTTTAAEFAETMGAGFPFRDFLVARAYDPRAEAAATRVARAPAERLGVS